MPCLLYTATLSTGMATAVHADAPVPDPVLRVALMSAIDAADSFENRFAAEVWLLDMATRLAPLVEDPVMRLTLLEAVHREAIRAELRPELVLAVIHVESHFKPQAISPAGARGLMQVMPFWKEEIGTVEDNLLDPETNLRYGCDILRYYIDRSDGDVREALARYNGSYGESWYPARVYAALSQHWNPN